MGWEQLLGGTRPVTVLVVWGSANAASYPTLEREAEDLFARAWQQLSGACGH